MGKECEQIQVTALSEYLQIAIEIAYLDGRYVLITISVIKYITIMMTIIIIMTTIIMRIRLLLKIIIDIIIIIMIMIFFIMIIFFFYYYRSFDEHVGLSKIKFPPDSFDHVESKLIVYLLYKPGHYDILYK